MLESIGISVIIFVIAFAIGYFPYTAIVLVITAAAVYANLVSVVANSKYYAVYRICTAFLHTILLLLPGIYESYRREV